MNRSPTTERFAEFVSVVVTTIYVCAFFAAPFVAYAVWCGVERLMAVYPL